MRLVVVVAVVAALALPAWAAEVAGVPDELKPWVPWVLHGAERERCPLRTDGQAVCEAPGRLELSVDKTSGSFTASWHVEADTRVTLPGDERHWPLDVEVDGKAAPVVATAGAPSVALLAGDHVVTGRFAWDAPPESLPIPPLTAAVRLVVDGRELPFIDRGEGGDRVWLKRDGPGEEREENRLDVAVFRKIVDGVPLIVETQVLLEVSGAGREVALPGALLDGFVPMSLTGGLPARVEGAALKVQVRPGRHVLTLVQRNAKDERELVSPKTPMGGEGSEEVWVYQADHAVRVAQVVGVPSIVAEQTRLPDAWRPLPAYRVLPGEKVTLDQQRRGDENPAPSQLSLNRTLWLDFDGKGFTVHDELLGRFTGDRLLMGEGTTLGRVSTGDGPGDAFITRLGGTAGGQQTGVEVRSPDLRVSADSRIEGGGSSFPAVSWAHDFQSVFETLHLPPGTKLLHASGVDVVETTWVKSWTLFELFLVVIITVAMGRLWGPVVGAVSLLAMVLTFQEDGAPRGLWIAVVALAALHRVLPPAFETRGVAVALRWLRFGTAIVVAMVALAFSIQQVRVGMYPVLEQPERRVGEGDVWGVGQYGGSFDSPGMNNFAMPKGEPPAPPPPPPQNARGDVAGLAEAMDEGGGGSGSGRIDPEQVQQEARQMMNKLGTLSNDSGFASSYEGKVALKKQRLQQIDPNAVVQTGPGLPAWGFSTVSLRFTGPVKKDQTISLVLLGPKVNLVLAFLRVFLVAFLVVVGFGLPGRRWPAALLRAFRGKGSLFTGAALLLLALGGASPVRAAEPSASTLEELKRRLLQKPSCTPDCAAIARMALEATPTRLVLRAEVHAQAETVVPLPGADKQWTAQSIVVDGKAWTGALRDAGALWIVLGPGRHDVVLEGALPRRDTIQLALPLVPHRATFSSTSWSLDGIREDAVPDGNLQLSRVAKEAEATATGAEPRESDTVLPPFLSVERSLLLGLSFEVETRVVRLSPPGTAIVVEVPLLPGESVTTEGVRAEGGKAMVSLGPNDVEVSWSGVVTSSAEVVLEAQASGAGPAFVEVWSLEASPVWHVEESGIPPLHDDAPRAGGARAWRPWPGEKLTLKVTRPEGVAGQTVTLERTTQRVRPGVSSTDVTLTLSLRASRGGEHIVTLPPGAELMSATVEGRQQPLRPDGQGKVSVPLVPGKQEVVLEVRVPEGIAFNFDTPKLDVGSPSVNAEIFIDVPSDRWILFAAGPRAGPAVLFWSFIVVLLLTGLGLSRVPFSPLKLHHWVLLGLGLTQVPLAAAGLVAGWLLALGWRKKNQIASPGLFNLFQLVLATWTLIALIALVASIHEGLLGAPDMQIAGNGSTQDSLRWFSDHATSTLPVAFVINAPMAAYRVSMLAWALWLAFALLGWLRVGWAAFAEGGMWRAIPKSPPRPRPGSVKDSVKVPEAPPGAPTSATGPSTTTKPEPGDKKGP